MRIIAGRFKGRKLPYREKSGLRVTSQKVKEAAFGIIGQKINNARVLDLYCGYGTLGLEALSRGASFVTFVDVSRQSLRQLKKFLEELGVEDQAEVLKKDAIKMLKKASGETAYDVIIMDPPYRLKAEVQTLKAVSKFHILKKEGICVVEHYSGNELPEKVSSLARTKHRTYGETSLDIYQLAGETLQQAT